MSVCLFLWLVAQTVKNLPADSSPGWEDPLEKGMQPIPVFLPREFQEQRRLAGYRPWDRKELDMTE